MVETVYWFGLGLGGTGLAAFVFHVRLPFTPDPQLFFLVSLGLFGLLTVMARRGRLEPWFVTHVNWLLRTWSGVFIAWVVGMVVMLCALFLGAWLLYVGLAAWGLAGLWFLVRHLRGYLAFRKRELIGA